MTIIASGEVDLKLSPTTQAGLENDLAKLGNRAGTRSGEEFHKSFAGPLGKVRELVSTTFGQIAVGAAGLFAGIGLEHLFSGMIESAQEAAKVTRLTEAVLQSTAHVAGLTSVAVEGLATKLSNLSGVNRDTVQSGLNVLLTFTQIRDGVGKGNDIFTQTSTAALNLSAALGEDLQSAIIQVGKAVNDPIKGITALRRVGVSFTAQQIDQVKALVASGHALDAQKLILRELTTEFGGAAAAAADPITKLKVVFKNLEIAVGTALLPAFNHVATFLSNVLPGALTFAQSVIGKALGGIGSVFKSFSGSGFISELVGEIKGGGLSNALTDFTAGFKDKFDHVDENYGFFKVGALARKLLLPILNTLREVLPVIGKAFVDIARDIGPAVGSVAALIGALSPSVLTVAAGALKDLGQAFDFLSNLGVLTPIIEGLAIAFAAWTASTWLLNFALDANPITLIVIAIAALAIGIVEIVKHFDIFRDAASSAWSAIQTAVQTAWDAIQALIGGVVAFVQGIIDNWFRVLLGIFTGGGSELLGLVVRHWSAISAAVGGAVSAVIGFVARLPGELIGLVESALGGLANLFASHWKSILAGVAGFAANVVVFFATLPARIVGAFPNALGMLFDVGKQIIEGLINGIKAVAGKVVDAAKSVVSGAIKGVKSLLGIGSPSRVFFDIGGNVGEGLALGLEAMRSRVTDASRTMTAATLTPVGATAGSGAAPAGGGLAQTNHFTVIDNTGDPRATAESVAVRLGQASQR